MGFTILKSCKNILVFLQNHLGMREISDCLKSIFRTRQLTTLIMSIAYVRPYMGSTNR